MRGNNDVSANEGIKVAKADELECFKKAAELGCKHFRTNHRGWVCVVFPESDDDGLPISIEHELPVSIGGETELYKAHNEFAAAVCAEFFDHRATHEVNRVRPTMRGYRRDARAFGVKYGTPR